MINIRSFLKTLTFGIPVMFAAMSLKPQQKPIAAVELAYSEAQPVYLNWYANGRCYLIEARGAELRVIALS